MDQPAPVDLSRQRITLPPTASGMAKVLGAVGVAALAAGFGLGLLQRDDLRYFFHAYLVDFAFFLSISLGALFFVALHHVCRAGWSVAVRRLAEIFLGNLVLLAVLFLPILLAMTAGNHSLYRWIDPRALAADELLRHKAGWLSVWFFALRAVVYFVAWTLLARFFFRRSLQQDRSGEPRLTIQMERFSGPALLILAGTLTLAAFDWLMSLEPAWSSTIFGVYYFSGAAVGFLAALVLVALAVQASGRLTGTITTEHYHDLGKLLFGFVVWWGYIAFSQYMLIWYGNIPEETAYYLKRQTGPWAAVSLALLFGQLLIPFLGMLSREVKRRRLLLGFWAAWLLAFHWLDVYWLVMPNLSPDRLPAGPIDLCLLIGIGGLYGAGMLAAAGRRPLVPLKDPRLGESLAFENV
jgi:hypothetical protein